MEEDVEVVELEESEVEELESELVEEVEEEEVLDFLTLSCFEIPEHATDKIINDNNTFIASLWNDFIASRNAQSMPAINHCNNMHATGYNLDSAKQTKAMHGIVRIAHN